MDCSVIAGLANKHLHWSRALNALAMAFIARKERPEQKTKRFDVIARECIKTLELEFERGIRRETNRDYIRAMNNCLTPYFGKFMLVEK